MNYKRRGIDVFPIEWKQNNIEQRKKSKINNNNLNIDNNLNINLERCIHCKHSDNSMKKEIIDLKIQVDKLTKMMSMLVIKPVKFTKEPPS